VGTQTACMAELAGQRDEDGRRLVVRNGYHQLRQVTTAAGMVVVKATGERQARR
jgi:putative transposase